MKRFLMYTAVVLAALTAGLWFVQPAGAAVNIPQQKVVMGPPAPITVNTKASVRNGSMSCNLNCVAPSPGNHGIIKVNSNTRFAQVTSVDITLHFTGDLVDPTDSVMLMSGEGFFNPGTSPISDRIVTIAVLTDLNQFADGHVSVPVWVAGSAYLSSAEVTITGIPCR